MQEFSSEVDAQPAWERGGVRAPHKPLTLLFAIGRAMGGERGRGFGLAPFLTQHPRKHWIVRVHAIP